MSIGAWPSADSEGFDYNTKVVPSVGPVLKIAAGPGHWELAARYALDYRPIDETSETGWIGFLVWSIRWR